MYNAKIIADSINPVGDRLTTFELTYPRFVHSELLTHRLFSRSSASSRALPTKKLLEQIENNPVMPKWWGKNQSGMQAREELTELDLARAKDTWLRARNKAVEAARFMQRIGLHKQIANRVLEPWMFITVIVSATEYENWFHLRCSEFAQPEIAWVAYEMQKLYKENTPVTMSGGDWHLPYVELNDTEHPLYVDLSSLEEYKAFIPEENLRRERESVLRMISTARCARVSYLTHDGKRDYVKDIELHDKLSGDQHWSPFEHVAQAQSNSKMSGNFKGWKQYRKMFSNEHAGRSLP